MFDWVKLLWPMMMGTRTATRGRLTNQCYILSMLTNQQGHQACVTMSTFICKHKITIIPAQL